MMTLFFLLTILPASAPVDDQARSVIIDFHAPVNWAAVNDGVMGGLSQSSFEQGEGEAEFSGVPHDRGTLGAARSQNPDSANSQFFINFADNHFLNRQYTVYGRVIEGMEHVDKIARGEPPMNPDRMLSVKVAADA